MNKTKIIATLGPRSQTEDEVFAFINAGMNVARINLSHGDRQTHERLIDLVKKARRRADTDTAILLDTRGPEIRVCDLKADLILEDGQELTITADHATCSATRIGVNYPEFAAQMREGHTVLLDDGKLALTVIRIEGDDVITRVDAGGRLMSRKRVSLPDTVVNLPSLTVEDVDDIIFGIARNVDFIAASFVRSADDVWEVRRIIEEHGGRQAIIAKIENRQGVDNLDEILEAAEGLMVARGDLGVEMPAEEVPIIQKRIIHRANLAGKPVITATQMLESMITSPTPTRAEANDVTNAIFDGTDAVMLSAETATGRYPVEAIRFLTRCARISEQNLDYDAILAAGLRHRRQVVTDSISYACCATAADLDAAAIITATSSGSTAQDGRPAPAQGPDHRRQPATGNDPPAPTGPGGGAAVLRFGVDDGRTARSGHPYRHPGPAHHQRRPGRDHRRHAAADAGDHQYAQDSHRRRYLLFRPGDRRGHRPRPGADHRDRE